MGEYDDNLEIALWKNDKRMTDRHPHLKGHGKVNGIEFWASAWKRGPDDNPRAPLIKIKLTAKEEKHEAGLAQAKATIEGNADDWSELDTPVQKREQLAPMPGADFKPDDDVPF